MEEREARARLSLPATTAIGVPICTLMVVEPFLADGEWRRATPYHGPGSGRVKEMQFLQVPIILEDQRARINNQAEIGSVSYL